MDTEDRQAARHRLVSRSYITQAIVPGGCGHASLAAVSPRGLRAPVEATLFACRRGENGKPALVSLASHVFGCIISGRRL